MRGQIGSQLLTTERLLEKGLLSSIRVENMLDNQQHKKIRMGSERNFGYVFCLVFAAIGLWPLTTGGEVSIWALIVALVIGIITTVVPRALTPLNYLWFKFGLLLGVIVSPIVMAIIFFLVITPIGLIMRATGNGLLREKIDKQANNYWIERKVMVGSMKNQF